MTHRSWYTIHKWIWIFTGVFLLAWLISGILMLVPQRFIGANSQVPPIKTDYEQVTIPPAEAIEIAQRAVESLAPAQRIHFRTIHNRPVYTVKLGLLSEVIVDAVSGEVFSMSPEFAKTIVIFNFPEAERPFVVAKLNRHNLMYPFGRLPVFRVTSQTNPSAAYYVDIGSGQVFRSTVFTRIRSALISLHDFSTLKFIIDSNRVRKLLLLTVSIAALVGALIGYYMALPKNRHDYSKTRVQG